MFVGQVVKIGKALSVPKSCYLQAKVARSPTAMTMYLTRAAFSRKRLIRSSYAGQKRKKSDGTYIGKTSLKRYQAMKDIQDFVLSRFSVSQSCFGAAVNACTGEKARARPEIEVKEKRFTAQILFLILIMLSRLFSMMLKYPVQRRRIRSV